MLGLVIIFNLKDIISIKDFNKKDINYILKKAEKLEPYARSEKKCDVLSGKILGMMFFEPSTRTKLSFETSMKRSGGDVVGFSQSGAISVTKGENLTDTSKILEGYSDALVIRHDLEGAARFVADIVDVPVINAGDGAGQHPTQTLLDLYTMQRILNKIKGLNVALMGDLKYGRTVHSLAYALGLYGAEMSFVSPNELKMPKEIIHDLEKQNIKSYQTENLMDVIDDIDVLYVTRIQKERFGDVQEYNKIKGAYSIDKNTVEGKDLIVMHPLPKIDEINPDLDNTKYAKYFQQAFYGVPVRMAILQSIMDKF